MPSTILSLRYFVNKKLPFRIVILFFFTSIFSCFQSQAQQYKFDYSILRSIAKTRTPEKNAFFKFISKYNNPVCLAAPTTLFITGLIKDDVQMKRSSLYVMESIASASLLNLILKKIFKRKRPYINDPTFIAVVPARNESFPSGHTAEAFSMASSMTFAYPKWYVILPTFGWASLIGYARMYLGVHYPTDVFAGATISSSLSWMMYNLNKDRLRK